MFVVLFLLLFVALFGWLSNVFLLTQLLVRLKLGVRTFAPWVMFYVSGLVAAAVGGLGELSRFVLAKSLLHAHQSGLSSAAHSFDLFLFVFTAPVLWLIATGLLWRALSKPPDVPHGTAAAAPEDGVWPPVPENKDE